MKKVLLISSSPRLHGNSDVLADAFALGARESGNEVVKVNLRDKKLHPCVGCASCYSSSNCVFDDMRELKTQLISADVIVLATPVYFHAMSAQLKIMIDRTVGFYEQLKNKEIYYIMTATSTEQEDGLNFVRCLDNLRGWALDCLINSKEKGIIKGGGLSKVSDAKGSIFEKQAYEMGKNI